jgi:hypothetical protein
MQNNTVGYLHLQPDGDLPHLMDKAPFLAILIADEDSSQMWQWEASRWLVESGCRVLLAWGRDADAWGEAVDEAALEAFNYDEMPDDARVVTTTHEDEELDEVFWFARHRAAHPACTLNRTLILHIAAAPGRDALEAAWAAA